MSAWPQQQNGIFPGMLDASNQQNVFDPSMYGGGGGTINPAQFNNPQMQQRMPPNGSLHPQNAFSGQNFNVGQVAGSKRSSDGIIMSPGPQQNPNSRSQTPMQPGTPFQGGQPGQQFANPYQHLQQGASADASPSPTIQNQQFRPPQRMTTQSPANFNPMQNAPPGQMSPASSNAPQPPHSMSMSPQAQQQTFSPNLGAGQGFNQQFVNPQGMMQQGGPNNMNNMNNTNMTAMMQAQLQQRQFQNRMLQQQQRSQASAMLGGRPGGNQVGGNPMAQQMGQQFQGGMAQQQQQMGANGQMQQMQQMQAQQQQQQKPSQQGPQAGTPQANTAEKARTWLANLQQFQATAGKPFNPSPLISGRPVNLYMLWACVAGQYQGSARATAMNAWPAIANKLGFQNSPSAAQELKNAFDMYISGWEKQMMAVRQAQRNAGTAQAQMAARQLAGAQGAQASPTRTMQDGQSGQFPNPMQQFQQAQQQQGQAPQMGMQDQMQLNQGQLSRPGSQMQNGMPMTGMPIPQDRQTSLPRQDSAPPQSQMEASPAISLKPDLKPPVVKRESSVEESREYICSKRNLDTTHGGYPVEPLFSNTKEIAAVEQESIRAQTMFMTDVRALTLSLQSGIASEIRYAIDSIIDLSSKTVYWREGHSRHATPGVLILDKCDDLLDSLLDCVEDHLEILAHGPVSSTMHLPTYEELLHNARGEQDSLRKDVDAGTEDFRLLNAADRLIALLGILSNVSMDQFNLPALVGSEILSHLSTAIRHVGTRKLFLQSHENTMDFYKLVINLLSNIASAKMELQSRDDAMNFLLFILAFGPQPPATFQSGKPIRFNAYNPAMHRYMPAAVDTLAKLLARQEPNRSLLRSIFSASPSSSDEVAPVDLLTRAFEMSIAFLPDRTKGPLLFDAEINLLKLRKAYLAQGMLAADVLVSLIPTSSTSDTSAVSVARAWLEADSRWPASLVRMAFLLSTSPKANENLLAPQDRPHKRDHLGQLVRDRATGQILYEETNDVPGMTANRALRMLLHLVETTMADKLPAKRAKAKSKASEQQDGDGAGEADEAAEEAPVPTNGSHDVDDQEDDSDMEPAKILIPGDPIPKRETITALLGTPQAVDTEAVRTMDKLYSLVMPKA